MNLMQVILLVIGVGAFVASFLVPEKKNEEAIIDEEILKGLVDKEVNDAKSRVTEVVDETVDYAIEKAERAGARISNEKIMAISEYSDTVMADINKAHQEVVFLYDMLNDKHKYLKETAKQVDKQTREAESKANLIKEQKAQLESTFANLGQGQPLTAETEVEPEHEVIPMDDLKPLNIISGQMKAEDRILESVHEPVSTKVVTTLGEAIGMPQISKEETIENHIEKPKQDDTLEGKTVEVYSFLEQAPHIDRKDVTPSLPDTATTHVNREAQAVNMKLNVERKEKEQAKATVKKAPVPDVENNNDKILRLHKSGLSSVDIAKELGLGVGEVKLVINLFKGAV